LSIQVVVTSKLSLSVSVPFAVATGPSVDFGMVFPLQTKDNAGNEVAPAGPLLSMDTTDSSNVTVFVAEQAGHSVGP
jgi:hypothetical protein